MKKEYDFSKGERGKFYNKDAEFELPIFLEPKVREFVEKIALRKKTNIQEVVNLIIKENIHLAQTLYP